MLSVYSAPAAIDLQNKQLWGLLREICPPAGLPGCQVLRQRALQVQKDLLDHVQPECFCFCCIARIPMISYDSSGSRWKGSHDATLLLKEMVRFQRNAEFEKGFFMIHLFHHDSHSYTSIHLRKNSGTNEHLPSNALNCWFTVPCWRSNSAAASATLGKSNKKVAGNCRPAQSPSLLAILEVSFCDHSDPILKRTWMERTGSIEIMTWKGCKHARDMIWNEEGFFSSSSFTQKRGLRILVWPGGFQNFKSKSSNKHLISG